MSKKSNMKAVNGADPEIQNRANQFERDLQRKLQEAANEFNTTEWNKLTFQGQPVPPLPDSAIEDFKKAYMDRYSTVMFHVAKSIIELTPEKIQYYQINSLLTVIAGGDPKSIAGDIDEFIKKRELYDMILQISEVVFNEHKTTVALLEKTIKDSYDLNTFLPKQSSQYHN